MVRPLTKAGEDDVPYRRPTEVEAQIREASQLSLRELRDRLLIQDRRSRGFLRPECLVYFLREGRRSNNQALMSAVLPVLLTRCEANLLAKVPDDRIDDAASLRQDILDGLTDLFVEDGSDPCPNELDYYECKFNAAFRTLRIDMVRSELRRRNKGPVVDAPPTEAMDEPNAHEDAFARISDAFKTPPTQEWEAFRERLVNAIEELPQDERDAVILVHGLGYKQESDDPNEETAATRCACSGRTIRNRLNRAAAKLARLKEAL